MGPLGSGLRCAAGRRVRLLVLLRLGVPLLLLLLLRMLLLLLHCACSRQETSSLQAPAAQNALMLRLRTEISSWLGR